MARPQTDIEAGREQLLDIAEAMIEERGNAGFTVTELAARAGMSAPNLYRYFESRGAVIEAVAGRWFAPKVAIMEEVVASDLPPRRKMYEFYAQRFLRIRAMWDQHLLQHHRHGADHAQALGRKAGPDRRCDLRWPVRCRPRGQGGDRPARGVAGQLNDRPRKAA